jgi:threonine synthase
VLAPAGSGGAARAAGAQVIELDGSWHDCRAVERQLATLFPWGFVATNLHPYAVEGPKTISFEIVEQFGWEAPDAVVCPVASGALLAKIAQGFHELRAVGLLEVGSPRLVGAQTGGYSPVAAAFAAGGAITAAEREFEDLALGAARTSGGAVLSVPAEDVDGYAEMLAAALGVEVDGGGGAALAALVEAVRTGRIRAGERVVLVVSGVRGGGRRAAEPARAVAPELDSVLRVLGVE